MYDATFGTSMLGAILGPRTSRTEEDFRGRDRSGLLDAQPVHPVGHLAVVLQRRLEILG